MTLMRQARKGNTLTQEPALETSLEQQILAELKELRGRAETQSGQIRDMRTILMGSGEPTGETQYGRIPMLETDVKDLKRDVAKKASATDLAAVKADVETLKMARTSGLAHWNMARVLWALLAGSLIAVLGGAADAVISALLRH
jgi:hypothetical protein